MYKINWYYFTQEQRALFTQMESEGRYDKISKILEIADPQQEREIELWLTSITPVNKKQESEVKKLMKEMASKGEEVIRTPEDEAKWQEKLDDEKGVPKIKDSEEEVKAPQIAVSDPTVAVKKRGRPPKIK